MEYLEEVDSSKRLKYVVCRPSLCHGWLLGISLETVANLSVISNSDYAFLHWAPVNPSAGFYNRVPMRAPHSLGRGDTGHKALCPVSTDAMMWRGHASAMGRTLALKKMDNCELIS